MKNLLLSLIVLLSLGATALMAQDADGNKTVSALKTKLTDANLTVDSEALAQNIEFVELVLGSESMDKTEKQYWLTALPTLVDKQIERMVSILRTEKQKLADLDAQYARESAQMTLRHAKERITKIHELLQKPKKYKLTEADLDVGIEAIDVYIKEGGHSRVILTEAIHILEYAAVGGEYDGKQTASLHIEAAQLYGELKEKSKLQKQEAHLQKAIDYLKKELETDNNDNVKYATATALVALTYIEVCKKDYERAIDYADEAFSYSSDFLPELAVNKAHALVFLGRIEDAKALYARAVNSGDKDRIIKAIKDDARELEWYGLPKNKIKIIKAIVSDKN